MTGYTVTTAGACTASFQATGKSGSNPPAICGTNTDYHSKLSWMVTAQNTHLSYFLTQVYVEFGGDSADSIELKHTLDTAQKSWNILLKQIACTASWKYNLEINYKFFSSPNTPRAPTDCVQYFTGVTGTVKSYNFAGSQILQSMDYGQLFYLFDC